MLLIVFVFSIIWGFAGNLIPLRRIYVKTLLKIFEFGSSVVHEKANRNKKESVVDHNEETNTEECNNLTKNVSSLNNVQLQQQQQQNDEIINKKNEYSSDDTTTNNTSNNGKATFINNCNNDKNIDLATNCAEKLKINGEIITNNHTHTNTVITREAKLNAPDLPPPPTTLTSSSSEHMNGVGIAATQTEMDGEKIDETKNDLDFQLESCFDYIKSGVESIIEDEVTSRFEAEELKNWNLLTRTNRRYEFISWKL